MTTSHEQWRKVRGGPYWASDFGRVRGLRGPLTPTADKDGYLWVTLRKVAAGVRKAWRVAVHVLVLTVFRGKRPPDMQACHDPQRSEGPQDCRLSVLRWDTAGENVRDKLRARSAGVVVSRPLTAVAPVAGEVP